MNFLMWGIVGFLFLLEICIIVYVVEYTCCVYLKKQVPFVACALCHKRAVVKQIRQFYPKSKKIVEVGSGFGGLARYVARHTNANVHALENMPVCVFMSKIFDRVWPTKSKTIWCDAFDWLAKKENKYDVAIAYLGPELTEKLVEHKKNIKVLISLNFEIPELKPVRVVELKGFVLYGIKKYSHKLYVYEFGGRRVKK